MVGPARGSMLGSMLGSLAPARRRLIIGVVTLALVAAAAVVVLVLVRRPAAVRPASQTRLGPVLLVSGYGGSTTGVQTLAEALQLDGRQAIVVAPTGSNTGDLRDQARDLGRAVDRELARDDAPSVDLVGYSAGGVVVRYYVAELGGGSKVRRVVSLAAPQHGTDLAALAGSLGSTACPTACRQLDPDSELLRGLNAGDETPPGPTWVALWTTDDATVRPPDSGSLDGALDLSLQAICPGLDVGHPQVPADPTVAAIVAAVLAAGPPARPSSSVCG